MLKFYFLVFHPESCFSTAFYQCHNASNLKCMEKVAWHWKSPCVCAPEFPLLCRVDWCKKFQLKPLLTKSKDSQVSTLTLVCSMKGVSYDFVLFNTIGNVTYMLYNALLFYVDNIKVQICIPWRDHSEDLPTAIRVLLWWNPTVLLGGHALKNCGLRNQWWGYVG